MIEQDAFNTFGTIEQDAFNTTMTMWQELKPKLEIPSGVLVENEKGINDRYKTVTSPRDIYKIYPNIVTRGRV